MSESKVIKQKTQFFDSDRGDAKVEWNGLIYPASHYDLQRHAKATNIVSAELFESFKYLSSFLGKYKNFKLLGPKKSDLNDAKAEPKN